ncbi:hypothetical protein [Ralstonia pseudosolanacearum]|uniref:hypothetical protein n=1 Tax=Ralstonia pseudosolanacearum TaxID=1310165 RepID=UPI0035231D08
MITRRLNAVIQIGGTVTGALKAALSDTQKGLQSLGSTIRDLDKRQKLLGNSIQTFGRMGKNVDGLRAKYVSLGEQLERTRKAQQRLISAQATAEKLGAVTRGAVVAGGAGIAAAGLVGRPLIGAAVKRENAVNVIRNSGATKEDGDAMIRAAQGSKQFGVSVTKATETVSELRTALGDAHHAIETLPTALKAISGLQMYDRLHHSDMASGDSAYQMAKVAEERGGATDPEAMRSKYNWAFKTLTGSNGKVSIADQLTAVRAGKGAVQAMSDEAFFGDTFLQQSMGADRYGTSSSTWANAWIGGHQTHSAFDHMMKQGLLNGSGVQFDKNGRVKTVSPDALVDAQTFLKDPQAWVDKHLIPLAKKQGVDLSDPASLMKFANAIASNPNVANMIVSRMRFDSNIWKDRRNVLQASGIDESDQANRNSTAGKMDNVRARLEDAQTRMGNVLLPAFASALEATASALEAVNRFAEESPTAFKAATFAFVGLTGAVAGLAAIGVTTKLATLGLSTTMTALGGTLGTVGTAAGTASVGLVGFLGKLGMVGALSAGALAAAKAAGLPDTDEEKGRNARARGDWWKASVYSPAGDFIPWASKRVWNSVFGPGETKAEAKTPATKTPPEPANGRLAPVLPDVAAATSQPVPAARLNLPDLSSLQQTRGQTVDARNQATYNVSVTAAPGMDHNQVADAVVRKLDQRDAVRRRGAMFDPAGAH